MRATPIVCMCAVALLVSACGTYQPPNGGRNTFAGFVTGALYGYRLTESRTGAEVGASVGGYIGLVADHLAAVRPGQGPHALRPHAR